MEIFCGSIRTVQFSTELFFSVLFIQFVSGKWQSVQEIYLNRSIIMVFISRFNVNSVIMNFIQVDHEED